MSLAIETRDLHYRPGRGFQISNLNMHVPSGSLYGFLGPNGAGKTTTIRLLLGLLKPGGGSITVLGHAMPAEHVAVLARTGYVPERPHLYPTLSVDEAKARDWLAKGAQPSDTVRRLLKQAGVIPGLTTK